jgi:hypothetical protein
LIIGTSIVVLLPLPRFYSFIFLPSPSLPSTLHPPPSGNSLHPSSSPDFKKSFKENLSPDDWKLFKTIAANAFVVLHRNCGIILYLSEILFKFEGEQKMEEIRSWLTNSLMIGKPEDKVRERIAEMIEEGIESWQKALKWNVHAWRRNSVVPSDNFDSMSDFSLISRRNSFRSSMDSYSDFSTLTPPDIVRTTQKMYQDVPGTTTSSTTSTTTTTTTNSSTTSTTLPSRNSRTKRRNTPPEEQIDEALLTTLISTESLEGTGRASRNSPTGYDGARQTRRSKSPLVETEKDYSKGDSVDTLSCSRKTKGRSPTLTSSTESNVLLQATSQERKRSASTSHSQTTSPLRRSSPALNISSPRNASPNRTVITPPLFTPIFDPTDVLS